MCTCPSLCSLKSKIRGHTLQGKQTLFKQSSQTTKQTNEQTSRSPGDGARRNQYPKLLQYIIVNVYFSTKNYNNQRERKVSSHRRKKADNRNCPWEGPDVRLHKDFKIAIINIFNQIKKQCFKKYHMLKKKGKTTRFHSIENTNKVIQIILKHPNVNSGAKKA